MPLAAKPATIMAAPARRSQAQTGAPVRAWTLDHRHLAVDLDVGTHAAEFIGVAVPVVPDTLVEDAGPLGQAQHRGNLRLHIGGGSRGRAWSLHWCW